MSKESTDTKEEKVIKALMLHLGILDADLKTLLLLSRAIEYADLNLYTEGEKVRHKNEYINNQIFMIKAQSYYNRIRLLGSQSRESGILRQQITEYEYREVLYLKSQLYH